ncbi:MAG: glycosyltransferase family 1 protein [Candidatus Curtissbacteria bacterium]|nr:glycosyltransferase family 1 protein [Candidatus Curtissbacteria bacterium]
MKVAIDASPLNSGHSVRGIGSYTQKLIENLKTVPGIELIQFDNGHIPSADVTHYPYFDLFFHTLPVAKKQKRIVTIHDVIPLIFPNRFPSGIKGYISLFFQKRGLKNTDFVICDSKTSKNDISDKLSIPKERIEVIYLAASESFKKIDDVKRLKSVKRKLKLPQNFALYVGDVNWNKNLENLINSIKISKVPLVMVGAALVDNKVPQTQALERLIKRLNLEDKIVKTGFVEEEDLVSIYNLAGVTILPSFYEGFGLPVLESMACGTPVVCSSNSSLAEIAGNLARFCDPQNPADIAKKTLRVLNMSKKAKESLSRKLTAHASTFSWQKTAKQTINVYKKVLG